MSRVAFTIVLNGEHHLKHNDYFEKAIGWFDYWVFAEGASNNTGSTSWCNSFPDEYCNDGRSTDGTIDYLKYLKSKYPDKVKIIISPFGRWKNKDEQVNAAILKIKEQFNSGYLWQMDVDEQWKKSDIDMVEWSMKENNATMASVACNYYLGEGIKAVGGNWGGDGEWYRCWKWDGELFKYHEPPLFDREERIMRIDRPMFEHYAYYFEKDVLFKSKYYAQHENIHTNWLKLKDLPKDKFPLVMKENFMSMDWISNDVKIVKE